MTVSELKIDGTRVYIKAYNPYKPHCVEIATWPSIVQTLTLKSYRTSKEWGGGTCTQCVRPRSCCLEDNVDAGVQRESKYESGSSRTYLMVEWGGGGDSRVSRASPGHYCFHYKYKTGGGRENISDWF